MSREEAIKKGYELKLELVEILKRFYHKSETLEQNLKKYNNLFRVPVSANDLNYIANTNTPDLEFIKSINDYINSLLRTSKYGRYTGPDVFSVLPNYRRRTAIRYNKSDLDKIILLYDRSLTITENWKIYSSQTGIKIHYNTYRQYVNKNSTT